MVDFYTLGTFIVYAMVVLMAVTGAVVPLIAMARLRRSNLDDEAKNRAKGHLGYLALGWFVLALGGYGVLAVNGHEGSLGATIVVGVILGIIMTAVTVSWWKHFSSLLYNPYPARPEDRPPQHQKA